MGTGAEDMSTTQQPEALAADHSEQTIEMVARWYMIDKDGMATLCTDREDAEKEAKDANMAWPHTAPHRAVQLVEVADVEAMRAGYDAARLEIESLQARIKTMAEEHADELMVAHLDGRMCGHSTEPAGAQQPGVATWTPLPGTLPEPGKPVLLDIGMEYPIRAMWAAKHALEVGMEDDSGFGEYDEATDTYYCPEGWYEWNEHEETHWAVDETPTAWCELPPNGGASHGQAPAAGAVAHTLSDAQIEAMPVWRNFVGLWPESRREIVDAVVDLLTTPPAQAADSVLEDAARYRWLRHGDNDEKVLKTYTSRPSEPGEPTMFLPRNDELDRLIDAARAAQEGK